METALLWSTQYIAVIVLSLLIAAYLLYKEPKVPSHRIFFIYSILVSGWAFSAFMHRTASSPELSTIFLKIDTVFLFISQALYLILAVSIRYLRKKHILFTLPSLFVSIIYVHFAEFMLVYTDFGWSYKVVLSLSPPQLAAILTNFLYNVAILAVLVVYYRRYANPVLKRKLLILTLAYLLFQFAGFSTSNLLLITKEDIPPIGGLLYILNFLLIVYALRIRLQPIYGEEISLPNLINRFLYRTLDSFPGGGFGEKYMKFSAFADAVGLTNWLSYQGNQARIKSIEGLDLITVIDKILAYFRKNNVESGLMDLLLPIINGTYTQLSTSEKRRLDYILLSHREILMQNDVFYGIDGGRLLKHVEADSSLKGVPPAVAALRIYKRILLACFRDFYDVLGSEFLNRMKLYDVVKDVELSGNGYLSLSGCLIKHSAASPIKIAAPFNSFLASVIASVYEVSPTASSSALTKIDCILNLNWAEASALKIPPLLAAALRSRISDWLTLSVLKNWGEDVDLEASKRIIGKQLEEAKGYLTFLKFTNPKLFSTACRRLSSEALAKGYNVVVFTRKGSLVREELGSLDVTFQYLTVELQRPQEEPERYIPLKDPTKIFAALSEVATFEAILLIFDNLSDLLFTVGFDKAYIFTRHLAELAAETKATIIVGLNTEAHNKQVEAAFETLSNISIELKNVE